MKNVNLINRDRLDSMLSLLGHECRTFFRINGSMSCEQCPYKDACYALNKLEIAVRIGDDS